MGVNLRRIVEREEIELERLRGSALAVDGYNMLYQFLTTIRGQSGEPLQDSNGAVTSHLSGLFYRSLKLSMNGISQIYVFDGKPPALKAEELKRRKERREEAREEYEEALAREDYETAKKFAAQATTLKKEDVESTKPLLEALGIPWIEAPEDGEAETAHLQLTGKADYAASQDYDSLLYGASRILRNIAITGKRKLPRSSLYREVKPEIVTAKLSRERMIDIAILMGTDFNDGIYGIGTAKAVKLLEKHGSLEKIEELGKELSEFDYNAVRKQFLEPKVLDFQPLWRKVDEERVKKILVDEHSFSEERVSKALAEARSKNVDLAEWL